MKKILKVILGVSLAVLFLFFAFSYVSRKGSAPGLTAEGELFSCPDRPNCVSSEEGDVEPISFSGTPEMAWKNVRLTIDNLGGTVEVEEGRYLAATFQTAVFRFVDDMEFRMIPEENLIQVRSGSRVGYNDMGVNRERVEKFRELFELNF